MLQNAESAQPVQKISRIETILMPPVVDKAGKPTGGKFRVDGMVGGKHYEITPTRNWNEMTVFDNAHQIETSKGKMALSDFLLKNVRGLTQLAIDQGFIKPEDADVEIPYITPDNKIGSGVEKPLKFLKGKDGQLTIPKNPTLEQTQNLMLLIFEKTKNTPDFAERDNKNGLTKILLEQIRNGYNKLNEAGKVPDDPKNPSGIFTEEPIFEALNIACRKAVEARLEEKAYRKTKTFERKGESRSQRLLNRLSIAAGIVDESTGGTARKQIKELQEIHQRDANGEKTSSLEFSVQMDLFMAQAFDILVPAEVRVQMKKAQIEIDNTADYKKRADLIQVANKEKQMWRMAILNHFQVERTLPSKTKIPSIADEIRNPKIFSWEERMKIENDYTNSVANEISSLEKSRKDQGGLAELDLSSVNLIKTEQLLEQILPKTGRPEQRAKRVEDALKELFLKTSEMIKEEDGKPPKKNTDKWDKYIKDTGLLTGLQGEQRELAKRAIEDALATQLSMEFKLQITSEKIGAPTKATDVKFGSEINRGLKGVELLYRRGVSQEIPKGKRYESLDSKGKPNYKMVMDDYGVYHIQSTKEAIPNEDYRAIEAAMSQTSVPKNAETDQVPEEQKIKDEQAVELAKLLGFKEPITNEAEFRENMLGSEIFVLVDNQEGDGQHYEIAVEMLNLTSTTELNSLSRLSEFYPNTPVSVEALNLTISETGNLETMPINNFNIDSLILSGLTSEGSETSISLIGGSCDYIEIRQGQFNISTDRAPIRVAMIEGHEAKASQMIFTEGALSEIISRNEDLRTEFMMGDNSVIQIVVKGENEQAENKLVYEEDSHAELKGNTGKFILINENGIYKLVDSEYKFAEQPDNLADFANIIGKPPPPNPEPTEGPTQPPAPEKFKHKSPEEISAMDPSTRVEYLQAELGATLGSRQRLALVRRIINECSENGVNVDDLIPKLGALSGVTGGDLATSPILAELMDDVSKLTIAENAPTPQPAVEDNRTPLEKFKDDQKLKPQPTPEPAASLEEKPVEAATNILKEQPVEAPQAEALEEVHTDVPVPTEAPSRPGIRELWANRPWWLGGGKEDQAEPSNNQGLTRAEIVRARRGQTQAISNPANDPLTSAQSAIPVNPSQTDTTLFESPANIPIPAEKVEQVGAQVTEASAAEDDNIPDWLKAATSGKKIASADDESSSGGGAAAEDDLDIPTWLKNRR